MRFLIQSVDEASVSIDNYKETIQRGILLYVAISREDIIDYRQKIEKLITKLHKVKLLKSDNDNIASSLADIDGEILLISNFTLYGENKKGTKINFSKSANFEDAHKIYDFLENQLHRNFPILKTGKFGSMMTVVATNIGPINYVRDF